MSDNKFLIKLTDGGIINIDTDERSHAGCPTCDYGSEYISEMTIYMTKYTIKASINQMYEYAINVDDTFKLFLPNIEEILKMDELEFTGWFKKWFYTKADKEDIDFKIKELD